MGGNTSTSQQQTAFPWTPSWLTGYYQGGANQAQGAQASLPNLSQLYNEFPTLQTAPISAQTGGDINAFQNNINMNPTTGGGVNTLSTFLGTPGTPSAATNAAVKEFADIQAPEVMQQAVLAGQGNSGAATTALANAQEQALVPFLQQDQSNTLNAANSLAQIGQNQQQITNTNLKSALDASQIPQQNQQQQNQATFDQMMNRLGYATNLQTGPLSGFQNLIGQTQNASGSNTQPKF